jgi:hypothetical protein
MSPFCNFVGGREAERSRESRIGLKTLRSDVRRSTSQPIGRSFILNI